MRFSSRFIHVLFSHSSRFIPFSSRFYPPDCYSGSFRTKQVMHIPFKLLNFELNMMNFALQMMKFTDCRPRWVRAVARSADETRWAGQWFFVYKWRFWWQKKWRFVVLLTRHAEQVSSFCISKKILMIENMKIKICREILRVVYWRGVVFCTSSRRSAAACAGRFSIPPNHIVNMRLIAPTGRIWR